MKLLKEDSTEITRDILYTISQQLANSSVSPFPRVKYETPQYAVVVNGLFFMSLSFSLVAALIAVLALQWTANYDMGLNTSSARKRALQRHTRWMGAEKWKMGEIIASLPLLIFLSLFLFFIGIANWLWHLNQAISRIVIGSLGIGSLVFPITNLISIVKLEAPFRTPVSKGLSPLLRRAFSWMRILVLTFPSEILKRDEVSNRNQWRHIRRIWKKIYSSTPTPPQSFSNYEELAVEKREETAVESLIWLANSIEISLASHDLFAILTKELSQLPGELLLRSEIINQAPWESIFTMLSSPYLGKRSIEDYTEGDTKTVRDICRSFSMISNGVNCPSMSTISRCIQGSDPLLDVVFRLMEYRHLYPEPISLYNAVDALYESMPSIEEHYLHFIFLTIQTSWPSLGHYRVYILSYLIWMCTEPSGSNGDPYPLPIKSLYILLDLVGRQDEGQLVPTNTKQYSDIIARYISSIRRMKAGAEGDLGDRIHRAIQQQILLHISIIDFSLPSALDDSAVLLELLSQITNSRPLALVDRERDKFIRILTKIYQDIKYRPESYGKTSVIQEALLNGLQYSYGMEGQPFNRWTNLILALDEYFERGDTLSKDDNLNPILFICENYPKPDIYSPEASLRDTFIWIKHPSIALWLAGYCPGDWRLEALIHPDFSKWNESVVESLYMLEQLRGDLLHSDLHIALLRAMITEGPLNSRRRAISFLEEAAQRSILDTEQVIDPIYLSWKPFH
jgi:hypothetical protein